MGRRKKTATKPAEHFRVERRGNTGIYESHAVFCLTPEAEQAASAHDNAPLLDALPRLRGQLADLLSELLGQDGWHCKVVVPSAPNGPVDAGAGIEPVLPIKRVETDILDGKRFKALDEVGQERVRDALSAMGYTMTVEAMIRAAAVSQAATWGYHLGRLVEKCHVRAHEANAAVGRKRGEIAKESGGKRSTKIAKMRKYAREQYELELPAVSKATPPADRREKAIARVLASIEAKYPGQWQPKLRTLEEWVKTSRTQTGKEKRPSVYTD